jgi:hypothetical protein
MRGKGSILAAAVLLAAASLASADDTRIVPDTFTATTDAMMPRDVKLSIAVRQWSDDAARSAVLSALDGSGDASKTLGALPTLGYVWSSGSPVGYSVKYAERAERGNGQRVTLVTDKRLGFYDGKPWTADGGAAEQRGYSVIELDLDAQGRGTGTMSLAADVKLDADAARVMLVHDAAAAPLLKSVALEPKPYWAKDH